MLGGAGAGAGVGGCRPGSSPRSPADGPRGAGRGDASPGSPFPALSTMRPDPRHKHAPRHPGAPLPPFGEKIKSNKIQYGSLEGPSGDGEQTAAPRLPERPAGQPHAGRAAAAAPRPDPSAAGEGAAHTRARTHTNGTGEGESFQPLQPNNQHSRAPDRHGGQHTAARPGPQSNGAARPESEGRGPGARREGGKSRETISGFFNGNIAGAGHG